MDCIFCKIAAGEIPSNKVFEDERCLVFHDIAPAAPVHALVVPKRHSASILEADDETIGHLMRVARETAKTLGLSEGGFRIVVNTGVEGGQTVDHLHIHVIGGRSMTWPPG